MYADYDALKAAIIRWVDNDDITIDNPGVVDDFIMLAHIRLNRETDLRQAGVFATFETVAGVKWAPLPQLYSRMRRLKITGFDEGDSSAPPSPSEALARTSVNALTYKPPTFMDMTYSANQQGEPTWYCVMGDRFRLAPIPNAVYTLEAYYVQTVPTLSASQTTNVFLTECSDLLLYASLMEGQAYIKDPERLQTFITAYQAGLAALNLSTQEERFPDGDLAMTSV